jgi:hypothetical protein
LCEALENINNDCPQVVADTLLAQALMNTSLVKDDMAVLVARIDEHEKYVLKLN